MVVKRDGTREPYDADRINLAIEAAAADLPDAIAKVTQVGSELAFTLFDGITTEQLDGAAIQVALQNVKDDPDFDVIAARLLRKTLYKRVLGDYTTADELRTLHRDRFPDLVRAGVAAGLLDERLGTLFDLDRLRAALDPERDELLRYIGVTTMRNRYMISARDGELLEVPETFWMRVAMGLALTEADPTAMALAFYERMSRLEYLAAGSTLVNAGTAYPQLSNCFVMEMQDDIEHIAKTVRDVMWLTKGTGGIGLSVTKLRAEGSPIRSNNTTSTGPIPFMHTIDSTLRAVSRGGKKFGALAFYMENWHLDFPQFLDLRQNSGDPYRRTRTANTAVWISDEFMRRVQEDEDWYLFDPLEVPDLTELYGAAFTRRYRQYVGMAQEGTLRSFQRIRAREQLHAILMSLQTTSHPWLTWKDTINLRALNDNTGTIHLSNLCTEITLPQDRDNVSVCNLASVNLARHLVDEAVETARRTGDLDDAIDWPALAATTRLAVRQLDDLIDITISTVAESEHSNERNRAVGLGIMGFTDIVERLGLSYESAAAYGLIDRVMEHISWHAIDASADLARERGAYPNFEGSGWSKGLVPLDTLARTAEDRGLPIEVDMSSRLDWDALRVKVAGGMRNATLMAIAPTASIGLVAGTTPGLDPQFAQIFSRTTSSGKFLEVNRNLVTDLRRLGLWEQVREEVLRAQGDISGIEVIPDDLKAVYRTSFQLSPFAFLEVAARAQKWIDQAISRNMYLETRDVGEMAAIYSAAWRMGVKTTYYLHVKPRHKAEQSTVAVNKAAAITAARPGRSGFGFAGARAAAAPLSAASPSAALPSAASPSAAMPLVVPVQPSAPPAPALAIEVLDTADTCPTDPQERLQCEACQ
ncbi:MAG: ribonucleoside-diphosphate reductase subunit alpha [Chloroflexi bacterium]|nr:ribonucleoside-diphosphate reductase subunit alpha [Chloroflexota bacterium]